MTDQKSWGSDQIKSAMAAMAMQILERQFAKTVPEYGQWYPRMCSGFPLVEEGLK